MNKGGHLVVQFIRKFFGKKQEKSEKSRNVRNVRREKYSLHATCHCGRQFSETEILTSFSPTYYRLYITCSKCGAEITPRLHVDGVTVAFRPPVVVLCYIKNIMTGKVSIDISDLPAKCPDLFYSAIFHFGSIEQACVIVTKSMRMDSRARLVSLLRVLPARVIAHVLATTEKFSC